MRPFRRQQGLSVKRILKKCVFALLATNFAAILDVQGFELSAGEQLLQREQQRQEAIKRDRERASTLYSHTPRTPITRHP